MFFEDVIFNYGLCFLYADYTSLWVLWRMLKKVRFSGLPLVGIIIFQCPLMGQLHLVISDSFCSVLLLFSATLWCTFLLGAYKVLLKWFVRMHFDMFLQICYLENIYLLCAAYIWSWVTYLKMEVMYVVHKGEYFFFLNYFLLGWSKTITSARSMKNILKRQPKYDLYVLLSSLFFRRYGNANVWKIFTDLFDYFPLTALVSII